MLSLKEYEELAQAVKEKVPGWKYAKQCLEVFDGLAELDLKEFDLAAERDGLADALRELKDKGLPIRVYTAEWVVGKPPVEGKAYYVCSDQRRKDNEIWRYVMEGRAMWNGQRWVNIYTGDPVNYFVTYFLLEGERVKPPTALPPVELHPNDKPKKPKSDLYNDYDFDTP